jgi:myo-inositol-1(or 4)-monophosphatase
MLIEPLEARYTVAKSLVVEAGALALDSFRSTHLVIEAKGLQDLVTAADREVEAFLIAGLQRAFPQDAFVGEESGTHGDGTQAPATWVIDPIDGTSNFARGIDLWCISVGLVVYRPSGNELFTAMKGKGAFLNGQPIRVSDISQWEAARIDLGFSFRRPRSLYLTAVERLLEVRAEHARLGSAALGLAWVACGRYDGYWEAHVNSWDVAGGLCLVTEAGGKINGFLDGPALSQGNPVLASNSELFKRLMNLLQDLHRPFPTP